MCLNHSGLLGSIAVLGGQRFRTIRGTEMPSPSNSYSRRRSSFFMDFLTLESVGTTDLQKAWNRQPNKASHTRRPECTQPEISLLCTQE